MLARALLVLLPVTLLSRTAAAYECTPVPNANPPLTQAWNQRCIPYYIDRRGTLFGGDERRMLIAQSFRVWSNQACTDLELLDAGYTDQGALFDSTRPAQQENVIVSVEDAAGLTPFPQDGLLAITLTSYSTETGEILDADILFNAVDFRFDDVGDQTACRIGRTAFDLRNTLIHEIGHLLGFDHTRAPDTESTMAPSAEPCETKKRDLTAGDIMGVCEVYAKGEPVATCKAPADYGSAAATFRCQCARVTGLDTGECEASAGCNCVATAEHPQHPAPWGLMGASLLVVATVVFGRRVRR